MTPKPQPTTPHRQRGGSGAAAGRQRRGSGAATALTLAIRKMAEEELQIVRRVPKSNKGGQDGMVNAMVLPRAGRIASWIRNTMTEMNKAYGLAIGAFIEAGGTYPCNGPGYDGMTATLWQRTRS
jgi:hypothetical protein